MRYRPDSKTKEILIGVALTGGALILFVYVLNNISVVVGAVKYVIKGLASVILGAIFAYFLTIPSKWLETKVLPKIMPRAGHKAKRATSIVLTLLMTLAVIAGLISIVLPHLISSLGLLLGNLDAYAASIMQWIERLAEFTHQDLGESIVITITDSLEQLITDSLANLTSFLPAAFESAAGVVSSLFNVVFGVVISVYILASREKLTAQFKKLFTAILPKKAMERSSAIVHTMDDTFRSYLGGQLIDALLVGIECYVLSLVFNLPYAPLIAVIIGITNMIPILGPYIGGIPCGFIVLVAGSPLKLLIFVVMVLVVQQIDGNIVAPRIIGDRTGVPGIWVVVGVMVGSYFFGILGVLLAIPVISVLLSLVREFADRRLTDRGEPVSISAYYSEPIVEPEPKEPRSRKRASRRAKGETTNESEDA